ncbi:3-beta hydroxysteroid dehydrogenase/isomerase family-domain-containing protein [Mycena maculata]|uniref:3-beta hydroxysteroid dehydrogenase/isomerase family-domain-containing protein n=1 Tax=Mycena maculata TaxID=230809 RepID=A0AAD7NG14_9AGAR|nr:3-beta hydroxysteroid dehydrogenase/isomerase family-domain-containing protein [Mycena maculata]
MAASKDVYLVLGGDVFVGRHVIEQLKARGDTVFVFDSTQRHDDVEFYPGDICIPEEISNAIQKTGATCIIHTISPLSIRNRDNLSIFHRVNVEGTRNVIAAANAAGVRKLIYHGSSGVVFGGRDIANGDESLPYPKKHLDPYTASRALAEELVLAANEAVGLKTACIRPTGIFGPGDQEMIVGAYDAWKRGMTHVQLGNNKNLFDRTYVGNVAHAILLTADKLDDPAVAGQTFFITNDDPRPFWDFMRSLWAGFDATFPDRPRPAAKKPLVIPRALALLVAYVMSFVAWLRGDKAQPFTPYAVTFATATLYFNSAKAKRALGYEPQVGVDEGIRRTMEWIKAEYEAGNFK